MAGKIFLSAVISTLLSSRYKALSQPESVHRRSFACNIEWPQFSAVSKLERDFPLGEIRIQLLSEVQSQFLSDIIAL